MIRELFHDHLQLQREVVALRRFVQGVHLGLAVQHQWYADQFAELENDKRAEHSMQLAQEQAGLAAIQGDILEERRRELHNLSSIMTEANWGGLF